jgi:phosphohistidine phosphatase
MRLILIRHSDAVDPNSNSPEADAARELTEAGKIQAAQLCDAFRRMNIKPDAILSSPLARARQTADALWSLLPPGREITISERLSLDQLRPRKLSKEVVELNCDTVILVGHMPDLGIYAAWLLGAGNTIMKFPKGGAMSFETDDEEINEGSATQEWFVTPEWASVAVAG